MSYHARVPLPPILPELVPLPPALTGSQLLTLAGVLHCCRDRGIDHQASPTLRMITDSLGVRFASSQALRSDITALINLGRVEVVEYTNCRAYQVTDLGRWHFPEHLRSGRNGDVRRYVRRVLANVGGL